MINFRFHLVSLVAVFLAIGIGVAMGASFLDRATVDTLRSRVDDLSEGYQRRGRENAALRDQLTEVDSQARDLAGGGSEALSDQLTGEKIVLITPDGFSDEVVTATRTSLAAADSIFSGAIKVQPELSLEDGDVLAATRDRLGLRTGTAQEVSDAAINELGQALAILSADAVGAEVEPTTTTTTIERPNGTTQTPPLEPPTNPSSARAVLEAMSELGLIALDQTDASDGATFPDVLGVRYVMATPAESTNAADAAIVPLARSIAASTGAVVTVGEARAPRPDGQTTSTTTGEPTRGESLSELRESDSAEQLSTVDDLEESNGRLALVFAVAEQSSGRVGHYGTGSGATAPFPTTPPEG
ncbi:MAG: copper transporter [Acidimicrobiales bacterium]